MNCFIKYKKKQSYTYYSKINLSLFDEKLINETK